MRVTAGKGGFPNATDLYNGASGTWSTAQLSVARSDLAATTSRLLGTWPFSRGVGEVIAV
jgi:hypothetical protein